MKDSIFVWIPRTAGKSVYHSLNPYGLNRAISNKVIRKFDNNGAITFGHYNVHKLKQIGRISEDFWNNSFKFCFVRNPYDRFVSFFNYKKRYLNETMEELIESMKKGVPPVGLYNTYKANSRNPQVDWITDENGKVFVDFVGQVESIQDDFKELCKLLGIKEEVPLKHLNKSTPRLTRLSVDEKVFVDEYYKEDFKLIEGLK